VELESTQSIKLGVVAPAEPFRTKPAPEAIWSLEWPVLLFQVEPLIADLPNWSFLLEVGVIVGGGDQGEVCQNPHSGGEPALMVRLTCELPADGPVAGGAVGDGNCS